MSIRVEEIADSMDFSEKIDDVDKRIQELEKVRQSLTREWLEWIELSNHFNKEEK